MLKELTSKAYPRQKHQSQLKQRKHAMCIMTTSKSDTNNDCYVPAQDPYFVSLSLPIPRGAKMNALNTKTNSWSPLQRSLVR